MPKVRDIMTSDVETAEPGTTLEEIATLMKDADVGSIPVVEDEELVGIVTDRDLVVRCIAEGKDAAETKAEDILSGELETVSPDADVQEAARIMARSQIRRLPVVEGNRLVGIVSLGDIAVKHEDEEVGGHALENISRGVKQESGRGRKQPRAVSHRGEEQSELAAARGGERGRAGASAGARGLRASQEARTGKRGQMPTARGRQQGSVRGRDVARIARGTQRSSTSGQRQDISSRAESAERGRQQKVSPARATGPASRRRTG